MFILICTYMFIDDGKSVKEVCIIDVHVILNDIFMFTGTVDASVGTGLSSSPAAA